MEVKISDWNLIRELERRIENGTIFRAGNGRLWPRLCPACGAPLRQYGVTLNLNQKELDVIKTYDEWLWVTKPMLDKQDLYLPNLPYKQSGKFYFVRCENFTSDSDPCPVVVTEWHRTIEDARVAFFEVALDYE